jgi:hypothetical protein
MKYPHSTITKAILLLSVCALLVLYPTQAISAQSTTVKAEPSTTAPVVGQTLAVNITISNVQNLFGVDVTLRWNTSVLKVLSNTSLLGVESHPNGVLHESILIAEASASQQIGEYTLVATSTGSAAGFSGSGTIATLTFNVTSLGRSTLELETELADKPAPGGDPANFIAHNDVSSSVDVSIPEFPTLPALAALIVFATAALAVSKKHIKKTSSKP